MSILALPDECGQGDMANGCVAEDTAVRGSVFKQDRAALPVRIFLTR